MKNSTNFDSILKIVNCTGGLDYSLDCARNEVELAKSALDSIPDNSYKETMLNLADFSLSRIS